MPDNVWQKTLLLAKRAVARPFPLAMLTIGFLATLVLNNAIGWLILLLALGSVGYYAISKLHDDRFANESFSANATGLGIQESMSLTFRIEELDAESRVRMKAIVRLQKNIADEIDNSPIYEIATGLREAINQTENVVNRALELASKRRELLRYLIKTDLASIQVRIRNMEAHLEEETDPGRKTEAEAALKSKRQELTDYQAIEKAADEVLTQLDSIECSLASLHARLVRIKSANVAEWAGTSEELRNEIDWLRTSVESVELSVNEVLSLRRF